MPPVANIVKAIYLNNQLWHEVDTTSIAGTIRAWGVAPSSISFRVNRHFDTDANTINQPHARKIRHLDNIKLVIIPAAVFFDPSRFDGEFPQFYDGYGNIMPHPTGWSHLRNSLDDFLAWQGVYVDPTLAFQNEGQHQYSDNFSVTCYDYRWCLNRCLFRTPPLQRHVYEYGPNANWITWGNDGDDADATNGRIWGSTQQCGYEFSYNASIPKCTGAPGKPWVLIVEHILRSAFSSYATTPVSIDGHTACDPGSVWPHIPTYAEIPIPETMPPLTVVPRVAGLRLDDDFSPLFAALPLRNGAPSGDYQPVSSDLPFAPADSPELTDRLFIPDPITISNTYLLNAVQQVLDAVGMFDMYMDQFNVLRFVRQAHRREIVIPPDDESTAYTSVAGNVYIARFADNRPGLSFSDATLPFYNVRSITDLSPRAVPEANRVVGFLTGRPRVANDIRNADGPQNTSTDPDGVTLYQSNVQPDFQNDQQAINQIASAFSSGAANIKPYRRYTHKVYSATATITVPAIHAFLYATYKQGQGWIQEAPPTFPSRARLLQKFAGAINQSPPDGGSPFELTTYVNLQPYKKFRFYVTYTRSTARCSVLSDRNATDDDGQPVQPGGHIVRLDDTLYYRFDLLEQIDMMSNGSPAKLACVYIVGTWTCNASRSVHRRYFAAPRPDQSDNENICVSGLGTMPSSENYSIDSSYSDPVNLWLPSEIDQSDDPEYAFPGLGEFTRAIIDADPIVKSVDELIPSNTNLDDLSWTQKWQLAKGALRAAVKSEALRKRQLVTENSLSILYDHDLLLSHRVVIWGTRDDLKAASPQERAYWMRLRSLAARIMSIELTPDDELRLTLSSRNAHPVFSLLQYAASL